MIDSITGVAGAESVIGMLFSEVVKLFDVPRYTVYPVASVTCSHFNWIAFSKFEFTKTAN